MNKSAHKLKEIYCNYIDDVFNQGRFDKLSQYLCEDYQIRDVPPGQDTSPNGVIEIVKMFKRGFPDFNISLDDVIAERDLVACRSTFTGTHLGEFMGIRASLKKVQFTSLTMVKFRDGQIIESRVRNDMETLKRQLR